MEMTVRNLRKALFEIEEQGMTVKQLRAKLAALPEDMQDVPTQSPNDWIAIMWKAETSAEGAV